MAICIGQNLEKKFKITLYFVAPGGHSFLQPSLVGVAPGFGRWVGNGKPIPS